MTSDTTEEQRSGWAMPTIKLSNERIRKDASKALETLEKLNATDVIDALGLRPYVRIK